jgi:TolB-like protein
VIFLNQGKKGEIMKKVFMVLVLCLAGSVVFAQQTVTLNEAIRAIAQEMGETLPQGSKIAVVNFSGPSEDLSRYVIDELNDAIVNGRKITVVDRQRLNLVLGELQLQDESTGLVSEESAQEIGRFTGAQYIVSGSLELIGGGYRFRTQAITVEGAILSFSGSRNVVNDTTVKSLVEGGIRDFDAAEIRRARSLNFLWGAGSFSVQKDMFGGVIVAALDTAGVGSFITGLVFVLTAEYLPEPTESGGSLYPLYPTYTFEGKTYNSWMDAQDARDEAVTKKYVTGGVLMAAGVALYATGCIVGYIRPANYHRPGSIAKGGMDPRALDIVPVLNERGDPGLRVTYKMSF